MASASENAPVPRKYGLLIFPGFQALDVFGPIDALNLLSRSEPTMSLSIISAGKGPVSTQPPASSGMDVMRDFNQSVVATNDLDDDAVQSLDVLIIPGGAGLRCPEAELAPYVDYVRRVTPRTKHIITVCTGAALAARAGALDGRRATTNKQAWRFTAWGPKTHWIAKARWVRDGDVWTGAGVSAGIDVTLAWIGSVWGEGKAQLIADQMEVVRAKDEWDEPFAAMYGCEDVLPVE